MYWSNEWNELDEVDELNEVDELHKVDEVDEKHPNSSWMKYFIFKMWSTSFIHQSEIVHWIVCERTRHHYCPCPTQLILEEWVADQIQVKSVRGAAAL